MAIARKKILGFSGEPEPTISENVEVSTNVETPSEVEITPEPEPTPEPTPEPMLMLDRYNVTVLKHLD
jgi:hypothetical protein